MSLFDTLSDVKYVFGRYFWPTIFLVVGIILLQMALVPKVEILNNDKPLEVEQGPLFLYGALLFLMGSVIWFLYLFGIVKTMVGYIIMAVMAVSSIYLLYTDYKTVNDDVQYQARYDEIERNIKARMMDIKSALSAYKEYNKRYTNNMDTLIYFIKTGKKMSVPNKGKLPERRITVEERDYIYHDNRPIDKLMTDKEANILAHSPNPPADLVGFSRDTIYLPVMEAIFNDAKFIKNRDKFDASLGFAADSLKYVPFSGQALTTIDTASVIKGDLRVPTVVVKMYHPMDSTKVYQIGDLNDNHLRDNWSK